MRAARKLLPALFLAGTALVSLAQTRWPEPVSTGAPPGMTPTVLAVSADGNWQLATVDDAEPALLVLDRSSRLQRHIPIASLDQKVRSAARAAYELPARRSFIVAFDQLAEFWEISFDPAAEPLYDGLVHDYRMGEGIARPGFLGARRIPLERPLRIFLLDPSQRMVLAVPAGEPTEGGVVEAEVIHLDIRRRITRIALPAWPAAGLGTGFVAGGRPLLAFATRPPGPLRVIDPLGWRFAGTVRQTGATLTLHPEAPALPVVLNRQDTGPLRALLTLAAQAESHPSGASPSR